MTFSTIFHELAAILMLAGVIGVVALKLRQPLIIGYILTGILVGPAALNWVSGVDDVNQPVSQSRSSRWQALNRQFSLRI